MNMIRSMMTGLVNDLGDDEVEVILSTSNLARDGHVLVANGAMLENYRANPVVLWHHSPDDPIGICETIEISGDKIVGRVRFAPLGISQKADEIRGLVKAGVVRAVSVGFDPKNGEPLDPRKPKGGQRFTEWELWELSFCSVPVDPGSLVTARAHGDNDMAEKPSETIETPVTRAIAPVTRAHRSAKVAFTRGMYDVGRLCSLFSELGWQTDMAKYEAAMEGDGSQVPAMLAGIMHDLGDAILAMAAEEIAEALAQYATEVEVEIEADTSLGAEERAHVRSGATPAVRAFRYGVAAAQVRAGKKLSAETAKCLREAKALHEEAIGLCRSSIAKHKEGLASVDDMLERAGVSDADSDATQEVQTSSGTDVSEGSSNGRAVDDADYRRRQADLLTLSAH